MRDTIMTIAEQREAFGVPVAGSLLLHAGLVGAIALLIFANARFHANQWGVNGPTGAIQANLVNSAPSIPLPQIAPPTPNVLATDLPSPAPAPPSKATIPITPPDAIPLASHKPKAEARGEATAGFAAACAAAEPTEPGQLRRSSADAAGTRHE